jgi:hypothetical protein
MDLPELKTDMDSRFDRLEEKLDKFSELVHQQKTDLTRLEQDVKWLQGSIKFSLSAIITIVGGGIGWLLSLLK